MATLLTSDTPKISRNSGISADDGVERKKSIRNSTLRYARSLLPSNTPSGTPSDGGDRECFQRALHRHRKVHQQRPAGEARDQRGQRVQRCRQQDRLDEAEADGQIPYDKQRQRSHHRQQTRPGKVFGGAAGAAFGGAGPGVPFGAERCRPWTHPL